MKRNRFFRTLALALILALLMVAIPVTPVLAAEDIDVIPSNGEIGGYVEVEGSGFDSDETIYIYFSSESRSVGYDIDNLDSYERVAVGYTDEGETTFSTDFDVPDRLTDGDVREDVQGGKYYVYAAYSGEYEIVAKAEFTIIGVTISPTSGVVGTEVRITGVGFDDREEIDIKFGTTSVDIVRGDDDTDSRGELTSYILVPESTEGDHTITVEVKNDEGEAEFTVEPDISIDPEEGAVGDSVTVTGTGFAKSKDVTITFDGDDVGEDETDTHGSFEATFNVPTVKSGTYDVEAEDESRNSDSATFKITTFAEMSPTTGDVGMQITVSGSGFMANGTATIKYDDTEVTTASIGSDGNFEATFPAPVSTGGKHTVSVSDGTNSEQFTFTMESTPPETPPPLLPMMGDKADSEAYFDWEDVDDPSMPVTYDLQIATDEKFTNKLVNKTGLTTSEYTLTEEEKLESTGEEAPYYWRVRAVDAASNASDWTGAGEFYVGFIFELTGWILYALMGVGAIVLFFLGFWVGRRGGMGEEY